MAQEEKDNLEVTEGIRGISDVVYVGDINAMITDMQNRMSKGELTTNTDTLIDTYIELMERF